MNIKIINKNYNIIFTLLNKLYHLLLYLLSFNKKIDLKIILDNL